MGWALVGVGCCPGAGVIAAESFVRRWQDMGPTVWLLAGALAVAWAVLYGLTWAVTDPRRVKPGARTLELPGSEPPVAVDDGTTARVAAWRFKGNVSAPRHSVVRGRVTRYLHHVRDYEVASGVGPTSIGDATTPG